MAPFRSLNLSEKLSSVCAGIRALIRIHYVRVLFFPIVQLRQLLLSQERDNLVIA